jgi:DNA-binding response OmpR family regulator
MMKERERSEILCVEDNDDECDLIKEILTDYEVTCAPTIANACSLLEKKSYALVILDEHLPDGSGLRFCAKIHCHNSPIILISGDSFITAAEAVSAGAKAFVTKSSLTYIEDLRRFANQYAMSAAA